MEKKREAFIVIVSAPSGAGKTTVVSRVLEKMAGIKRSVSYTTRPPRKDEKSGQDYMFVTEAEFEERKDRDDLLECEENFGKWYGTSKEQVLSSLEDGDDIILSIDVRGARQVKKAAPDSVSIFIMPPSEEVLAERLLGRKTDGREQIAVRLREAKRELEASEEYDYLVVNDELDRAVNEVCAIIEQEREKRKTYKKEDI